MEELGIVGALQTLMEDIEFVFAQTGFPTFPLNLLPLVHLFFGWLYFEIQGQEEIKKSLALYLILLTVPPLLYLVILFGLAFIFDTNRNSRVNNCLNLFNETSMPQGIHVHWNESYDNYAHARLQRFYGSKYTPPIHFGQPALMVKMNIPARQQYCRENRLHFYMPYQNY